MWKPLAIQKCYGRTDGPTDTARCRVACPRLKKMWHENHYTIIWDIQITNGRPTIEKSEPSCKLRQVHSSIFFLLYIDYCLSPNTPCEPTCPLIRPYVGHVGALIEDLAHRIGRPTATCPTMAIKTIDGLIKSARYQQYFLMFLILTWPALFLY